MIILNIFSTQDKPYAEENVCKDVGHRFFLNEAANIQQFFVKTMKNLYVATIYFLNPYFFNTKVIGQMYFFGISLLLSIRIVPDGIPISFSIEAGFKRGCDSRYEIILLESMFIYLSAQMSHNLYTTSYLSNTLTFSYSGESRLRDHIL